MITSHIKIIGGMDFSIMSQTNETIVENSETMIIDIKNELKNEFIILK